MSETFQVTVFLVPENNNNLNRLTHTPCGQPRQEGKKFCAVHEADRIRLGGKP